MEESEATASTIINFAEKLEDDSSSFYEKLAEKNAESASVFLSFAEESKKNKVLVIRTYRETITDALEACFSFEGMKLSNYVVKPILTKDTSYSDALRKAMELEDKASKFYLDVAERSKSLLATIPSAFRKVADRRNNRKQVLESLLDKATAKR
jgi:rubrerythrin